MKTSEIELMLAGYGLTTANIFYHRPDFQTLLQTYLWQDYDMAPDFPKLHGFLDFWTKSLDGPLHSVQYSHQRLIGPGEWQKVDGEFIIN
ncbi:MAG: aspartate-semialdehyde dehydrogenase [Pseudomonadota bacterium]